MISSRKFPFPFLFVFSLRRVRGILNKITPEKFEKLIADILNIIGAGSNVVFKGVIVLVSEGGNNSSLKQLDSRYNLK